LNPGADEDVRQNVSFILEKMGKDPSWFSRLEGVTDFSEIAEVLREAPSEGNMKMLYHTVVFTAAATSSSGLTKRLKIEELIDAVIDIAANPEFPLDFQLPVATICGTSSGGVRSVNCCCLGNICTAMFSTKTAMLMFESAGRLGYLTLLSLASPPRQSNVRR
jgi:hypothetical protein